MGTGAGGFAVGPIREHERITNSLRILAFGCVPGYRPPVRAAVEPGGARSRSGRKGRQRLHVTPELDNAPRRVEPPSPPQAVKKKPTWKRAILILTATAIVLFVLFVGLVTGVLPFVLNTIRCGKLPVVASRFAASFTYKIPGDPGYGPGLFNYDFFCSKEEAEHTGFHHSPLPF